MSTEHTPDTRGQRRSMTRRAVLGAGALTLAGAGGTGAWAWDRFLREKVEVQSASALETDTTELATFSDSGTQTAASTSSEAASGDALTYDSDTSRITVETKSSGTGSDTLTWYVATITLADARALRSAFADDAYGENIVEKPSAIAERVGAVLAINGDYYGFRSTGIVIRNGVAYRDVPARDALVIMTDGTMQIIDETTTSASALVAAGAWQCLSFGPAVVVDGAIPSGVDDVEIDTNVGNHSIQGEQPRTAVGRKADGSFVFMVVDGRSDGYSRGATMSELATLLIDEGCDVAYNLDGGGSSVMFFSGQMVSRPRGGTSDRDTSDILYIAG